MNKLWLIIDSIYNNILNLEWYDILLRFFIPCIIAFVLSFPSDSIKRMIPRIKNKLVKILLYASILLITLVVSFSKEVFSIKDDEMVAIDSTISASLTVLTPTVRDKPLETPTLAESSTPTTNKFTVKTPTAYFVEPVDNTTFICGQVTTFKSIVESDIPMHWYLMYFNEKQGAWLSFKGSDSNDTSNIATFWEHAETDNVPGKAVYAVGYSELFRGEPTIIPSSIITLHYLEPLGKSYITPSSSISYKLANSPSYRLPAQPRKEQYKIVYQNPNIHVIFTQRRNQVLDENDNSEYMAMEGGTIIIDSEIILDNIENVRGAYLAEFSYRRVWGESTFDEWMNIGSIELSVDSCNIEFVWDTSIDEIKYGQYEVAVSIYNSDNHFLGKSVAFNSCNVEIVMQH